MTAKCRTHLARAMLCSDINAGFQERPHNPLATRFALPVVYFFYPETAYRSLEEMDSIFQKTKNIFTVIWTAKHEPRRYRTARSSSTMRRAKSISDAQALLRKGAQAWATLRRLPRGAYRRRRMDMLLHEESKV